MIPPVWNLKFEKQIKVKRWPKSGEMLATIGPKEKNWVLIDSVSRHVIHAIIASEDARFYHHSGLDFVEIFNSFEINLKKNKIVRGGSTITQQLVKMAFLTPEKTILRKVKEAFGALLLEQILSKKSILEWYVNMIEFGDGVYGLQEASEHYFETKAELLTIQQGANLALVLPSPNGWSYGLRKKALTEFGHKRFSQIVFQMFRNGFITKELMLNALATGNFGRPIKSYKFYLQKYGAESDKNEATLQ